MRETKCRYEAFLLLLLFADTKPRKDDISWRGVCSPQRGRIFSSVCDWNPPNHSSTDDKTHSWGDSVIDKGVKDKES